MRTIYNGALDRKCRALLRRPPYESWSIADRSVYSLAGEGLWIPNATRPEWLDGSLPGDRAFDPLGLSKPSDYLQVRPALRM